MSLPSHLPKEQSGTTDDRLHLANELLLLAERAAKAGTWHWNMQTGHLIWSSAMFELFGLDPAVDAASFEIWRTRVHPEDLEDAEKRFEEVLRQRKPLFNQYRITLPNGDIRWIDAYGDVTYDATGEPLRMSGFCIDATTRMNLALDKASLEHHVAELRRVEQELRESEQRLEFTLNASGLGIWDYRVVSGQVDYDGRWCAIVGYDVAELAPTIDTWKRLVHPEDFARVDATAKAHLRGETPTHQSEHRLRHKEGHWVWILASGRIVERNPEGMPTRLLGTIQDISGAKRLSVEGLDLLQRVESLVREVAATQAGTSMADMQPGTSAIERLSRRQRQTLQLIARGLSSAEIAEQLNIATGTAIAHRRDLMRKLDLHSSADVTRFAIKHKLIDG